MNPPSPATVASNSNNIKNGAVQAAPVAPAPAPEPTAAKASAKTKPVTINIGEDIHRKLRIVALSKGSTTSHLVESYVESALRKDLAIALSKLTDDE